MAGVEHILSFGGMVLMAMLIPLVISTGRYVRVDSGSRSLEKKLYEGDLIQIFANKVYPSENQCEKYPYFDLPFCPPAAEQVNDRKKSLEEVLSGDCFTLTKYEVQFIEDKEGEHLCRKNLTKEEVKKFRDAIKRNFQYQMGYNKHVFLGMVGRIEEDEDGLILSSPKYYLATHIRFYIKFFRNLVKDIYVLTDYNYDVDITEDAEIEVNFTYSAYWEEEPYKPGDFLNYDPFEEDQKLEEYQEIWNSWMISWINVTLLWIGFIVIVTVPYLRNYFGRYSYREGANLEMMAVSPQFIHGDTCKCPPYTSLLGAILGNGNQLFITVCIFFFLAYKGFLHPCDFQSLSSQILRTYCFTSVVAGVKATIFHAGFSQVGWKECIFQTGTLYFIPAASSALVANVLAITKFGISEVPELRMICENLALWGLVTAILLIGSAILAHYFYPESQPICATRELSREARLQPWYMKTLAQMLLFGLLPSILIFPDMDNICASLWNFKICGAFHTLLTSFIMIVVMTVILAIGVTIYQLWKHDHQWWWKSVFRGGSPAIYMFFYGLYYFYRVDMEESLLLLILGYHACISYALFLILGTISYYASSSVFHCTDRFRKHE